MNDLLKFCKICQNRKPDFQVGLLCGLTDKKPDFKDKCPNFIIDKQESERKLQRDLNAAGNVETGNRNPQQNIIIGSIILAIGSLVTIISFIEPFGNTVIVAYGAIGYGIFSIIKGNHQNKILADKEDFDKKISK